MNREQEVLSLNMVRALTVANAVWERTGLETHISALLIRDENEEPKIPCIFIGKLCSDRSFWFCKPKLMHFTNGISWFKSSYGAFS
jgi:hypothetical protein